MLKVTPFWLHISIEFTKCWPTMQSGLNLEVFSCLSPNTGVFMWKTEGCFILSPYTGISPFIRSPFFHSYLNIALGFMLVSLTTL